MKNLFIELYRRNLVLFYLSVFLFVLSLLFLMTFHACQYSLSIICQWIKPSKFAISFLVYVVTLSWYMEYLNGLLGEKRIRLLSWLLCALVLMEMGVIFTQSITNSLSEPLYHLSNAIIVTNTVVAIYIGLQFFRPLPLKPVIYLWGIRAGFAVFILSCFLGAFLVIRYGQVPPDNSQFGLPFTKFSSTRDILISIHFLGIHYLQLLPLCCYLFEKHLKKGFIFSSVGIYTMVCLLFVLTEIG